MYIFVYGTLKTSLHNHKILRNPENGFAKFICGGKTLNKFPLIIASKYRIPFLLDKCGVGHNIIGEIYEIDEKMLQTLDKLEEYPEIYDRRLELIVCNCQNANFENESEKNTLTLNQISAWIYLFEGFKESILHEHEDEEGFQFQEIYLGEDADAQELNWERRKRQKSWGF